MDWNGYQDCCHRAALDVKAAFCGTCRTPLIRCMNFAECLQLVDPTGPCGVCLKPELVVEAGAVVSGGVGARLAIPLKLRNHNAEIRRPIYLSRLVKRESGREPVELPVDWETVNPGEERSLLVEAGPFDTDGTHRVELLLTLSFRSKEGFDEAYVFGGALLLTVSRDQSQQVVQNINFAGAHFETGGLVKTDLSLDQRGRDGVEASHGRQVVPLERFERLELSEGVRGYQAAGVRVPRTVRFRCAGFNEADAPSFEVGLGARGALALGRSGRERDPQQNPTPMDLTLRAYGPDGTLDLDKSRLISRHLLDLVVIRDRLLAHVRSAKGALVGGRAVDTGGLALLKDGDVIAATEDTQNAVAVRVRFRPGSHGQIDRIDLTREPAR